MTAVRYNRLWIKLLIVLLLVVLGLAGIYYAYEAQETVPPDPEDRIEEEEGIPERETVFKTPDDNWRSAGVLMIA